MLFAFDLDRTLLKKNSSVEFCRYLYDKGFLPFSSVVFACFYYIRHVYFGLTLEQLHQKSFERVLKGLSQGFLLRQVTAFLDTKLDSLLYFPALDNLQEAKRKGHFTVILSAAPSFLVEDIAKRVKVDEWKGSEYDVDKDGNLCKIAKVVQGKEKARYLKEKKERLSLSKQEVIAYSDSHLDLPFLHEAGKQIVVNPNKKLKKIAKKLGWKEI